jgi:hypothetical protein
LRSIVPILPIGKTNPPLALRLLPAPDDFAALRDPDFFGVAIFLAWKEREKLEFLCYRQPKHEQSRTRDAGTDQLPTHRGKQ